MRSPLAVRLLFGAVVAAPALAHAFCGFYVGKADTRLFNRASQVALVRDGDRTVLTMSNDYEGPLKDFALVVPVPSVLTREQIHVGERALIERLDAYSTPRLVEYFDANPCQSELEEKDDRWAKAGASADLRMKEPAGERARALGVTVEAQYTVGEYDIALLSATESSGLETYLKENGYQVPAKASAALAPYIRQDMKFFVAKVNLGEHEKAGVKHLRPIQIAYESPKFMLPIRLGMANANGTQDLVVYALTRKGRVESTNYRTVMMPTGMDVPVFVQKDFGRFYKSTFAQSYQKEHRRALLTEYAWDMGSCDPCSAEPLNTHELRQLGVFWTGQGSTFLTRLHVRYDSAHFPEDLVFQQTADQQTYQARYVLRHAFSGGGSCTAMTAYQEELDKRHQEEAKTLALLTGWDLSSIHQKMGADAPRPKAKAWFQQLWQ